MAEDKVYLLTQEAYDKMKEELARREGELSRRNPAHKVAAARAEGDLSARTAADQAAREAQRARTRAGIDRAHRQAARRQDHRDRARKARRSRRRLCGDASMLNGNVRWPTCSARRDLVASPPTTSIISPEFPDWRRPSTALTVGDVGVLHRTERPRAVRDRQGRQAARLSDVRHKLNLIFQRYKYKADSSNTTDEPAFSYISSNCNQI